MSERKCSTLANMAEGLLEPVGKLEAHESQDDDDRNDDSNQDSYLRSVENYRTVIEHNLSRHVRTYDT